MKQAVITKFTLFFFAVLVIVSCGSGADATKTSVPGAPTIGVATAGNSQATITFTAPESNGGSVISGYTMISSPGGITATGAASPITVTGLTNGTAYTFTGTATNAVGTGTASAASNSVIPKGLPGAPTIGTATAGNGQASIIFTAPASNGGSAITGYTATSSPGDISANGTASPITVTGLTNGTAYSFTVAAINDVGTGIASAASNSVTPSNTTQPTTAIIKLATTGTLPSGVQIGGIDVTLHLPAGVMVKSTTNPPETDSGIVASSGLAVSNSSVVATYSAVAGTVRILLANQNGFGTGEFATVNCVIAAGSNPAQADFSVSGMTTKNMNGSAINGLTAGVNADIH